jgi:hypothetical protein
MATQQTAPDSETTLFAMMAQFDLAQTLSTSELDISIGNNKDNQLIVDIAIAELQMDSDFGMVCSDYGVKVSDSHSSFVASSIGNNPIEDQYKNAV